MKQAKPLALLLCALLLAGALFGAPLRALAEGESEPPAAGGTAGEVATGGVYTPDFEVAAEGVYMVNEETGVAVYAHNEDAPFVQASLVKMMTCMLVVDNIADLDGTTISSGNKSWLYDSLYGRNASTADIRPGETLTVRELLYAALLPSGNEAALLLADHIGGGYMPNFLYMMNERAQSLGCTGTFYADACGLSEENVSTARDLSLITRAFMSYPELVAIAAAPTYQMAAHEQHQAPYNIHTTNRLLVSTSPYYSAFGGIGASVVAGKTGSLGEWQNFASLAKRGADSYICVVLHAPDAADAVGAAMEPAQARPALYVAAALYDWAFRSLTVRPALDTTQAITEVPVRYSTELDAVRLLPSADLRTILPVDADDSLIEKEFNVPDYLPAPVARGEVVGTVTLRLSGHVIGTADLLTARDVKRNTVKFVLSKIGEFFASDYFKVVLVLVLVLAGVYAAYVWRAYQRRQQRTAKPPARSQGGPHTGARERGRHDE